MTGSPNTVTSSAAGSICSFASLAILPPREPHRFSAFFDVFSRPIAAMGKQLIQSHRAILLFLNKKKSPLMRPFF